MVDLEPWDQQPGESDIAYATFRKYLESEPPRDLGASAELQGMARSTFYSRSSKWDWTERVRAWDAHRRQTEDDAVLKTAAELATEHMRDLADERRLAMAAVRHALKGAKESADYLPTLQVAGTLLRDAIANERLVIGEATSREEQRQQMDWGKLDAEEKEQFVRLLRKAGVEG